MLNTSQTMANYGVYSFFSTSHTGTIESFVSPFFGLANNVKLSFFVYSMKKSAKNVVLTDFKRYPVCGMFFFFSFLVLFPVIRPSHTFTFFISSSPSSRILLRKALRSWSSPSMRSPPIIMVSSSARNSSAMFSPSSFSSTML